MFTGVLLTVENHIFGAIRVSPVVKKVHSNQHSLTACSRLFPVQSKNLRNIEKSGAKLSYRLYAASIKHSKAKATQPIARPLLAIRILPR